MRYSKQLPSGPGPWRILFGILLLVFFAAPRWAYWHHLNLNPDSISYWSAGRAAAQGQGLTWQIKPYFYPDDGQVVKPAVGYLSVPFTLLLAALQWAGLSFRTATFVVSLLGLLDSWLVYAVARQLCSRPLAAAAALLFLVNPEIVIATTTLWTEPLALAFALGAYLLAAHGLPGAHPAKRRRSLSINYKAINYKAMNYKGPACSRRYLPVSIPAARSGRRWRRDLTHLQRNACKAAACGVLLGLGYLTRPADAVYMVAVLAVTLSYHNKRAAPFLIGGAFLVILPYWLANWRFNGSPFFSLYSLLEHTLFYGEAMYTGFGRHYPGVLTLVIHHWPAILHQVERNCHLCIWQLSLGGSLGILGLVTTAICLILVLQGCAGLSFLRFIPRPSDSRPALPLALLGGAGLNFVVSCLVWATHEETRFVVGTWILLLILGCAFLDRIHISFYKVGSKRLEESFSQAGFTLAIAVVLVTGSLCASLDSIRHEMESTFVHHGLSSPEARLRLYKPVCKELDRLSSPGAVVAATDPWMVHYLADRPTVLLPALRPGEISAFITRYKIRWMMAHQDRMPDPWEGYDFALEARRTWRQRDWRLQALSSLPFLEEVPLQEPHGSIRLYRVLPFNLTPPANKLSSKVNRSVHGFSLKQRPSTNGSRL